MGFWWGRLCVCLLFLSMLMLVYLLFSLVTLVPAIFVLFLKRLDC